MDLLGFKKLERQVRLVMLVNNTRRVWACIVYCPVHWLRKWRFFILSFPSGSFHTPCPPVPKYSLLLLSACTPPLPLHHGNKSYTDQTTSVMPVTVNLPLTCCHEVQHRTNHHQPAAQEMAYISRKNKWQRSSFWGECFWISHNSIL